MEEDDKAPGPVQARHVGPEVFIVDVMEPRPVGEGVEGVRKPIRVLAKIPKPILSCISTTSACVTASKG